MKYDPNKGLEVKNIQNLSDAKLFVEGCLNDYSMGEISKDEFMDFMGKYTARICEIAILFGAPVISDAVCYLEGCVDQLNGKCNALAKYKRCKSKQLCDHPRIEREYIGSNMFRCNICGKEISYVARYNL